MTDLERSWHERADAYALGEAGPPGPAPDSESALEVALYAQLAGLSEPQPSDADEAIADAVLARFAGRPAEPRTPRGRSAALWVGLAFAAAAAILLVFLGRGAAEGPSWTVESGEFRSLTDASRLRPGDAIADGREASVVGTSRGACVRYRERRVRARVCGTGAIELAAGEAALVQLDGANRYDGPIRVATDKVSLEAADARFDVAFVDGAEGPVRVSVVAGSVAASRSDDDGTLIAGDVRVFGAPVELARAEPSPAESSAPAESEFESEFESPSESAEAGPPQLAEPTPDQSASEPTKTAARPRPTAAELLARARAKKGDRDLAGAKRSYRELVRIYPQSPEAHASRISLGKLLLRSDEPKAALEHFEAYAERGGPLLEEAMWGRVQALDALGRTAQRDEAIAAMAERFPASAYTAKAMKLAGSQP